MGGHFSAVIVRKYLRMRVYWPRITKDIVDYILGCIRYTQYRTAIRSQPLTKVMVTELFQLFRIDFIRSSDIAIRETVYLSHY
jgi:hypothetical protein